jgi:hypothetical protein
MISCRTAVCVAACASIAAAGAAQAPQPFPRGNGVTQSASPSPAGGAAQPPAKADPDGPSEADLGMPIYPAAQFLTSYAAGRGQRYYLFGVMAPFEEMVNYYKAMLKSRGDRVFKQPATHMFEVGRFREATMAFPPGVTIKDYSGDNSGGYLSPRRGVPPERFRTIIQIVPAPAAPAAAAGR